VAFCGTGELVRKLEWELTQEDPASGPSTNMNRQSCPIKVRWGSCGHQQIRVSLDGKKPVEETPSCPA